MHLKRKLKSYNESVSNEIPPNEDSINKLYSEINEVFTLKSKKTLENVRIFHENMIKNRKSFLKVEILEIEKKLKDNEEMIEKKVNNVQS